MLTQPATDQAARTRTIDELKARLKRFAPESVAEIEGANEVNNKFPPQELKQRPGTAH